MWLFLGNEIEIPAGKQVYNFTCTLPPVLPSSFEGQHGFVRYTIKVTLDRPWKFDQETKMAFTVINALDLNLNPSYRVLLEIYNIISCNLYETDLISDYTFTFKGTYTLPNGEDLLLFLLCVPTFMCWCESSCFRVLPWSSYTFDYRYWKQE